MHAILTVLFLSWTASVGVRSESTAAPAAQIGVSPDTGSPGTIFELTGSGFPPLSTGGVTFEGIDLGQISSDENGNVRGFFMVPDVRPGGARVRVDIGKTHARAPFQVLPPGA
jgi:hypothetical protein